jgi:hypothetical protein
MVGYYWKKNSKWNKLEIAADPNSCEIKERSEEEFFIDRYWGYSSINANETTEFRVEHPRWNIYPIENYSIDCDFKALYGIDFVSLNNTAPASVFLAEGSPAVIYSKKIL